MYKLIVWGKKSRKLLYELEKKEKCALVSIYNGKMTLSQEITLKEYKELIDYLVKNYKRYLINAY